MVLTENGTHLVGMAILFGFNNRQATGGVIMLAIESRENVEDCRIYGSGRLFGKNT